MGVFVNYSSNMFAGLINVPTTILTASTNVLLINSIMICNRTANNIRFNLQKVRTGTTEVAVFYVNELEIEPFATIDIVESLQLQILLEYSLTPPISDSLNCFSNGYTQVFDCEITYTQLNELPPY
jgi:hypothetical protein